MDLRQSIEEGCRRLHISERELARQAGLGVGTLTRWKSGSREPRISELRKLAQVLGVPVLDLVVLVIRDSGPQTGSRRTGGRV
jgi:transcriptional regulator with XRE-family HTH domain